ncbi:hypothetical protein N0B31_16395 [Salinirubellus salinus]|jgi:hypothetical protein|uniref:Uncharacterized protein n=1 Tax=Salinirubellus salinus TaxID=1364945 RepID=A0A9E7R110_9EURY|nr:hypothetical protein [Salinirubellus salinus]UWM53705.1 hypothetical protein N0B31_16395 [Salinirubellus salinus]
MVVTRRRTTGLSRRELGAGAVAAVAALVAALVSLVSLSVPTVDSLVSVDARYWFGYAPGFATLAGLVVGAVVWRRLVSRASTPGRGALAGAATGLGTVVAVPFVAGVYVLLFPVLLGLVTGTSWDTVLHVLPGYVQGAVDVTRTMAVDWSPLAVVVLVPLDALLGWAYQRGSGSRGR